MKKYKWLLIIAAICLVGAISWYWKFGEKEKPLVLETEKPHAGFIANFISNRNHTTCGYSFGGHTGFWNIQNLSP
jgi:hypothetical protein